MSLQTWELTFLESAFQGALQYGKAYIINEFSTNWVLQWILYIHNSKYYTSDVEDSKKQNNCVTCYLSFFGHMGYSDNPQGKKPVYLAN